MCNMKVVAKVLAIALVLSLSLGSASAKDLTGHVGVGTMRITVGTSGYYTTSLSTDHAFSIRYFLPGGCLPGGCLAGPNAQFGVDGRVFMSFNEEKSIGLGGSILLPLVLLANMNLYLNGGLNIGYTSSVETRYTSINLPLILEVEYFFSGLPALGFTIGAGLLELTHVRYRHDTQTSIRLGSSTLIPNVGFHYYFNIE